MVEARAVHRLALARKVLGWPKRCQLAHAFLWEYSYKRLQLAQLLGQLGVLLATGRGAGARGSRVAPGAKHNLLLHLKVSLTDGLAHILWAHIVRARSVLTF